MVSHSVLSAVLSTLVAKAGYVMHGRSPLDGAMLLASALTLGDLVVGGAETPGEKGEIFMGFFPGLITFDRMV